MGRRKIEIEMVDDCRRRQVTFSKRRTGLFKKANELATLCGADVGIVVFSPGGKPFTFGNPSIQEVTDRFLDEEELSPSDTEQRCSRRRNGKSSITELTEDLHELTKNVREEKKRGEELERAYLSAAGFDKPEDELSLQDLIELRAKLVKLQDTVREKKIELEVSSSLLTLSGNKAPVVCDLDPQSQGFILCD